MHVSIVCLYMCVYMSQVYRLTRIQMFANNEFKSSYENISTLKHTEEAAETFVRKRKTISHPSKIHAKEQDYPSYLCSHTHTHTHTSSLNLTS